TGKSVVQVALNWLLQRPSVSNIVIGARNEEQLKQNLGVVGCSLTAAQTAWLDKASHQTPIYPYWHQIGFAQRNPKPTTWCGDPSTFLESGSQDHKSRQIRSFSQPDQ